MILPTLRKLLEAGAHFGHKRERSHPQARRFVYTVKDGVLVINVEKTVEKLGEAMMFLREALKDGKTILFVGTKPQAQDGIKNLATSLGQPFATKRWLGGTLTNFETVKKSLFQLEDLEKRLNDPSFETLPKRERVRLKEKHGKLLDVLSGIQRLTRLPDIMFVVDATFEDIAVSEAKRLGIPVVAITDTTADPTLIDYPIPANDESKRSVELILGTIEEELRGVKPMERKMGEEEKVTAKILKVEKTTPKPKRPIARSKSVKELSKPDKSSQKPKKK